MSARSVGATASSYWRFADADQSGKAAPPLSGIVTTGDAHGDASHALLTVKSDCVRASMTQTITTPASEADRGPAVRLWYRTSGAGVVKANVSADYSPNGLVLAPAASWTQRVLCLDPSAAHRPTILSIEASKGSPALASCADIAPETFAIDDVEVTTDPSCPVN